MPAPSNAAQLRLRRGARASPAASPQEEYPPPHPKIRRSSTFSDTVSEARQSIKTSTDELLLPRAGSRAGPSQLRKKEDDKDEEESVWQSTPLALALLPALGGLLFQNGSAVVTDGTLIILAGIFLNWSVRLPWNWYQSTRGIASSDPSDEFSHLDHISEVSTATQDDLQHDTTIPEQDEQDEVQHQPVPSTHHAHTPARRELQHHELVALASCFIFPLISAWLLHQVRSQLSRPSEGLVSNYNLTIFLLAAEIRPFSHLLKLVQARTLHLQRVVAAEAAAPATAGKLADMAKRLDELETHIADSKTGSNPKDKEVDDLSISREQQLVSKVHGLIQPDLDHLKRATRRSEKRVASTFEVTDNLDKRYQELQARLDSILALPAIQQSRNSSSSVSGLVQSAWAAAVVFPVRSMWTVACWPARLAGRGVRSVAPRGSGE